MSIKNNTTSLQNLLEQVNALPEAENLDAELSVQDDLITQIQNALEGKSSGGGGSIETCTVDLASAFDWELTSLRYSDGNEVVDFFPDDTSNRINLTVVKNTLLCIILSASTIHDFTIVGDAEAVYDNSNIYLFSINGDCSIDPY